MTSEVQTNVKDKTDTSDTHTKIVAVSSKTVMPGDAAMAAYAAGYPVKIKETCYGLVISGDKDDVDNVAEAVRNLDKNHIFIKDRGFPVGDKRRCRADRKGGQRPGFYTLSEEIGKFGVVGDALDIYYSDSPRIKAKWPERVDPSKIEKLIKKFDEE